MNELTKEEFSVLERYSAGNVPWKIIENLPLKKIAEDVLPTAVIVFGGTYIAKTVIDNEKAWAVLSEHKGKLHYSAYADTLGALLEGL